MVAGTGAELFVLHNGTAYNASEDDLNGEAEVTTINEAVVIQLVSDDGYDGTMNFEASIDGSQTWWSVYAEALGDITINGDAATNFAYAYVAYVPKGIDFRVRLSGGTQGSATVKARFVSNFGGR